MASAAGQDEKYLTFTKLDAEGKPLWIRDARKNLVMQYITPPVPRQPARRPGRRVRALLRHRRQSAVPAQHGCRRSLDAERRRR